MSDVVTMKSAVELEIADASADSFPSPDGVVYSRRKNICRFSTPPLEEYARIIGDDKVDRLQRAAERLQGVRLLELNATAQGGGVAEMLYSSVPFMNMLGVDTEWKIINGSKEFFECTKSLHNLLQGMKSEFTPDMDKLYCGTLSEYVGNGLLDCRPDVIIVNDPQPFGLANYLKKPGETWFWRCHIDIEENPLEDNPDLWDFMTRWIKQYDAAIFSAAHYIVSHWGLPKVIIPPFIDPLSEKNRELSQQEIDGVLAKYQIDAKVPIIAQVGRFDPWKGLDRTIATYRLVRREMKCQLILAGGMASDDPEGARILEQIYEQTANDEDVHILNLSLDNRLENWKEVNALQRAATVIMQPSTREGFGLVITEALWKGKPVIAANVGAIPLQIREGDTGYFYETPGKTAHLVLGLLKYPKAAKEIGERGRIYVKEHFLLPDRVGDYLMAVDMAVAGGRGKQMPADSIISFHPWFKLSKRRS